MKFIKCHVNGQNLVISRDKFSFKEWEHSKSINYDQWVRIKESGEMKFINKDGSNADNCFNGTMAAKYFFDDIKPISPVVSVYKTRDYMMLEVKRPKDTGTYIDCGCKHQVSHSMALGDNPKINQTRIVGKVFHNKTKIVTHEKGVGKVLSCGSAAVATAEYLYNNGEFKGDTIKVESEGGYHLIRISPHYMEVSATVTEIYKGEW